MWRMWSHFRHFLEVGGAGEEQPCTSELSVLAGGGAVVRLARHGKSCVVKHKFHYHSGMTKPTNQKSTAIEEIVCYIHRSQEKRVCPALPGKATRGELRGLQEAEGVRGKLDKSPRCFHGKERPREGKPI